MINTEKRLEIMELLREELPVLRAKAKVSQEDIAERIGISRQTYSSIETGKRTMTWTTFLALIMYFQNNPSTLQLLNGIEGLSAILKELLTSDNSGTTNEKIL